jgi:multicomponent Na+:H+ antiporter subunit E
MARQAHEQAQHPHDPDRREAGPYWINLFVFHALLTVAWGFVTGNFTLVNLVTGFILAYIALWLPSRMWGEVKYFRRLWLILRLIGVFLYELAVSGFTVAKMVMTPGLNFRSGIIAIPLNTRNDFEITLFANLISLTPGTLSIDVSADRRTLYVHVMATEDPEADKNSMKQAFEQNIAEALE